MPETFVDRNLDLKTIEWSMSNTFKWKLTGGKVQDRRFPLGLHPCKIPEARGAFLDNGIVKQMVAVLKGDHCDSHEHLMSALLSLVSSHEATRQFCLQENLNFKSFLVQRSMFLEGKDEFQEERTYAEELLKVLNKASTNTTPSSQTALLPV